MGKEIIYRIIDDLKCCGNCGLREGNKGKEYCLIMPDVDHFYSSDLCDFWEDDLRTKKERMYKITDEQILLEAMDNLEKHKRGIL